MSEYDPCQYCDSECCPKCGACEECNSVELNPDSKLCPDCQLTKEEDYASNREPARPNSIPDEEENNADL